MIKFTTLASISLVSSIACYAQAPDYEDYSFLGRWVEWTNGKPYPENGAGDIKGFWSTPFELPLHYHENIFGAGWLTDLNSAIQTWNNGSEIIGIKNEGVLVEDVYGPVEPGDIWVFRDEEFKYIPEALNCDEVKALGRAMIQVYFSEESHCSDPNAAWNKGPIMATGKVAIYPTIDCFFEGAAYSPAKFSILSVFLHELGHVMGLNHHNRYIPTEVMYRGLRRSDWRQSLSNADEEAINRLYGYDGLEGGTGDPMYSSIDCEYFEPEMVQCIVPLSPDGTVNPMPNATTSVPPCENCVRDESEEGIDCGGSCGLICENFCTGAGIWKEYTGNEPEIMGYTVVTDFIGVGDYNPPLFGSNVVIPDADVKYMKAGQNIDIGPGFTVEHGAIWTAEIGSCDCAPTCTPLLPNVFTPNCDGINDFYFITVNGYTDFNIKVYNRWDEEVVSSPKNRTV